MRDHPPFILVSLMRLAFPPSLPLIGHFFILAEGDYNLCSFQTIPFLHGRGTILRPNTRDSDCIGRSSSSSSESCHELEDPCLACVEREREREVLRARGLELESHLLNAEVMVAAAEGMTTALGMIFKSTNGNDDVLESSRGRKRRRSPDSS